MSLTKQDLKSIAQLTTEIIDQKLASIAKDISGLKKDMTEVKEEIKNINENIVSLTENLVDSIEFFDNRINENTRRIKKLKNQNRPSLLSN